MFAVVAEGCDGKVALRADTLVVLIHRALKLRNGARVELVRNKDILAVVLAES